MRNEKREIYCSFGKIFIFHSSIEIIKAVAFDSNGFNYLALGNASWDNSLKKS